MMALEVALEEVANGKKRRLLAYNESSRRTDVGSSGTALFSKAANRKSAPRWRGPAKTSDFADSRVAIKFQSQTFKVASYCVRKTTEDRCGGTGKGPDGKSTEALGHCSMGGYHIGAQWNCDGDGGRESGLSVKYGDSGRYPPP